MMNFVKKAGDPFLVGTTEKGNTISFVPVDESKLVLFNSDNNVVASRKKGMSQFTSTTKPTKLIFYCNFPITTRMVDELETSKIIRVDELCAQKQQVIAYPLSFFNYTKLQDILFDMVKKFDL